MPAARSHAGGRRTGGGVSPATASKALNGRRDVAAETRERVLAAVAELGYRPGRRPRRGVTRRALAVVFDIPASPYILNVLQGVLAVGHRARLDLLTRLAPDRAARTQRAAARAWIADQRVRRRGRVVGLTLSGPTDCWPPPRTGCPSSWSTPSTLTTGR